jgi:ABC-type anion transport system duplicated permease subunit
LNIIFGQFKALPTTPEELLSIDWKKMSPELKAKRKYLPLNQQKIEAESVWQESSSQKKKKPKDIKKGR